MNTGDTAMIDFNAQARNVNPLYLSVPDAAQLILAKGLKNCIAAIADNLREDFLRWDDFDKSRPRRQPLAAMA